MKQIKEGNLDKNNLTPLHIAAEKDSIKMGELLISKGADINAQNILNLSITTSAKNNNIKSVEFLMTKGADINAIDIIYLNIILIRLFLINII